MTTETIQGLLRKAASRCAKQGHETPGICAACEGWAIGEAIAAERERCAKIAERLLNDKDPDIGEEERHAAEWIATIIREGK